MNLTFALILGQITAEDQFALANQRIPAAAYLFNRILPEQPRPTYNVATGKITIRSTMAGLVGMDSKYPEGGLIKVSDFKENTAKIAQSIQLSEQSIRDLQATVMALQLNGGAVTPEELMSGTALNLYDKGVLQALDDTKEYMRAQAIMKGMLNFTFNKKTLSVDYGVPNAHRFAERTGAEGYGGNNSKFWEDDRAANKLLKNGVRARICSPDTLEMIINNPANKIVVVSDERSPDGLQRQVTIRRAVFNAESIVVGFSQDARDTSVLIAYGRTGNIIDVSNPEETIEVPFCPDGVIAYVGNNMTTPIVVAGTPEPQNALGYTHIGPTVEGGNRPGQWGRIYVPENEPWAVRAEAVANVLPVIESPEKLVILKTEMSG